MLKEREDPSNVILHLPARTKRSFWFAGDLFTVLVTGEESGGSYTTMELFVRLCCLMRIPANAAPNGSSVTSVHPARSPFSGQQDPGSQQVEPGPPIHLPLQQLDPRHLALHLTVAPG